LCEYPLHEAQSASDNEVASMKVDAQEAVTANIHQVTCTASD